MTYRANLLSYLGRERILLVSLAKALGEDKLALVHDCNTHARNTGLVASHLNVNFQLGKHRIGVAWSYAREEKGTMIVRLSISG